MKLIGPFFSNQTGFSDGEESDEDDNFTDPDEIDLEEDLNTGEKGSNPAADGRQGALAFEIEKLLSTEFLLSDHFCSMVQAAKTHAVLALSIFYRESWTSYLGEKRETPQPPSIFF